MKDHIVMNRLQIIDTINRCLDINLLDWQIDYIFGYSDYRPKDRRTGKTTAYMLKLMLSEGEPIHLYDPDILRIHCDGHYNTNYYRWFLFELKTMYNKLNNSGLTLRNIYFFRGETLYEKMPNKLIKTNPEFPALMIGFDSSGDEEYSVLVISKREGVDMTVVNTIQGKEAEKIYEKLTNSKFKGGNKNE